MLRYSMVICDRAWLGGGKVLGAVALRSAARHARKAAGRSALRTGFRVGHRPVRLRLSAVDAPSWMRLHEPKSAGESGPPQWKPCAVPPPRPARRARSSSPSTPPPPLAIPQLVPIAAIPPTQILPSG